jgi:hypothetical protein
MLNQLGFVLAWGLLVAQTPAPERQGLLRESFETPQTAFKQEDTDARIEDLQHERSGTWRRDGELAERFAFQAGPGSYFHYSYRLPRVPITPEIKVSIAVRASRPGTQLFARVILPADLDPQTDRPSFVMIPGSILDAADRWQMLEIENFPTALARAVRILRVGTQRPISIDGAYIDRIVINLYSGPGPTEIALDQLTIGPVPESLTLQTAPEIAAQDPEAATRPRMVDPALGVPAAASPLRVQLQSNRLKREGQDWVPTAVSAPGVDPALLRQHGFDVLLLDMINDRQTVEAARDAGMFLAPRVSTENPQESLRQIEQFQPQDAVAFWMIDGKLGRSRDAANRKIQLEAARALLSGMRDLKPDHIRISAGLVAGDWTKYSFTGRGLDLVGVSPEHWGSDVPPLGTLAYLQQRRELAALRNPQGFYWAAVETTPPAEFDRLLWGGDSPPEGLECRVQPEQIRLYTYAALMAGYRGLAFLGDASLAAPAGRERMLELALLNAELDLVEAVVARGSDPITIYPVQSGLTNQRIQYRGVGPLGGMVTSGIKKLRPEKEAGDHPSIRVASISTPDNRGRLLLLADLAPLAQWQPPQLAANDLVIRVPCPESAQAFEITLGETRVLDRTRVPGGVEFRLPVFDTTALILISTDLALSQRLEAEVNALRPRASELGLELARLQYNRVVAGNQRLAALGQTVSDSGDLIELARQLLESANEGRERQDFALAWSEAQRARRALRHLMHQHFLRALAELGRVSTNAIHPELAQSRNPLPRNLPAIAVSGISSPALLSWETLPRHYQWLNWIAGQQGAFGANLLPSGAFDDPDPESLRKNAWVDESYPNDEAVGTLSTVPMPGGSQPGRCLRLTVTPQDPNQADRRAPFLDHPAVALRSPAIRVQAHQFVRIRAKVLMPRELPPGNGGLIIRDSVGGERLAFRQTSSIPAWREVVLYRFVPKESTLTVTLGLAGYGECFIDDLIVERIETSTLAATPSNNPAR